MTSFHARCSRRGTHDEIRFFAGPDDEHRALLGWIKCRPDETAALWRWLGGRTPLAGAVPEDIYVEVPQ